jgi:hypothetical protein
MPWLDSAWLYRKKITVQAGQVSGGPHTNFPFLYSSDDADVNAHARPDGGDLRFTLEDGTTLLDRELIRFYQAPPFPASQQIAHVRVPSLSAGQELYVYFGNPAATEPGTRGAVWPGHSLVIHGELDGGQFYDSSPEAHVLTNNGCVQAPGKIGAAIGFTAVDSDSIVIPDDPSLSGFTKVTISAWVKHAGGTRVPITKYNADGTQREWVFQIDAAGGQWEMSLYDRTANAYIQRRDNASIVSNNSWHKVVGVWDGGVLPTDIELWLDGAQVDDGSQSDNVFADIDDGTEDVRLGVAMWAGPAYFQGSMQEVRIIEDNLSGNWITTNYNNENDPASFFTLGPLENAPSGGDGTEGGRGGGGSTGVTSYPVAGRHGRLFRRTRIPSR